VVVGHLDVVEPEQLGGLFDQRTPHLQRRGARLRVHAATVRDGDDQASSRTVSLNSRGGTSSIASARSVAAWKNATVSSIGSAACAAVRKPWSSFARAVTPSAWKVRIATHLPVEHPPARTEQRRRPPHLQLVPGVATGTGDAVPLRGGRHVRLPEDLLERGPRALTDLRAAAAPDDTSTRSSPHGPPRHRLQPRRADHHRHPAGATRRHQLNCTCQSTRDARTTTPTRRDRT
jgi:hypothetical protein